MAERIFLSVTVFDTQAWLDALRAAAPDREIVTERAWPDDPSIAHAVVWKQPPGALDGLTGLRSVVSLGAGVDHIVAADQFTEVPVVRVVAPDLTARMSEYVVWQVLDQFRQGAAYRAQQAEAVWLDRPQPAAGALTVGVMGLGALGSDAARKLAMLGFRLAGWSRSPKTIEGMDCYAGADERDAFLAASDIVVVLLPLTDETHGLIDAGFLSAMKRETPIGGPVLVQAGRGGLQDEDAIVEALDTGRLMAASLDVFATEPLPASSPLWTHPRVAITPHAAAASDPAAIAPIVLDRIAAIERGERPEGLVDRTAGY